MNSLVIILLSLAFVVNSQSTTTSSLPLSSLQEEQSSTDVLASDPEPTTETVLPTTEIVVPTTKTTPVIETTTNSDDDVLKNVTHSIVQKLCLDLMENQESCNELYQMIKDERYLRLTWDITVKLFFQRPFGLVIFVSWTIIMFVFNIVILFLCTLLRPLRSVLLTRIVSDLRRRYYFTNDSSELHIVDSNAPKHKLTINGASAK